MTFPFGSAPPSGAGRPSVNKHVWFCRVEFTDDSRQALLLPMHYGMYRTLAGAKAAGVARLHYTEDGALSAEVGIVERGVEYVMYRWLSGQPAPWKNGEGANVPTTDGQIAAWLCAARGGDENADL